jgi:hypothetical protein
MHFTPTLALLVSVVSWMAINAGLSAGKLPPAPAPRPIDARFAPYSPDPNHPWNRLHQALFLRHAADGGRFIHSTDPLLYRGGTFLLVGEPHLRAAQLLDEFAVGSIRDPLKRLYLQRDLWAAFDYAAWYPDEWVFKSKYEPAAIALRSRLAKAIGQLTLTDLELAALPDNYALAVKSKRFTDEYDPKHLERPFLPPDLFDPAGSWVRFHETNWHPMTERHFEGAGGRAAHVVFLRLPGGRAATERYLKELRPTEPFLEEAHRHSVKQFPEGTMVAMVRRAFAVDRSAKIRATPIAELVQIRVYRHIPKNPEAHFEGDSGVQDAYEFVLDRDKLFSGQHGLRAVSPDDPAEPFFDRSEGRDPFERNNGPLTPDMPQLKTCIECHRAPGVYSILSMVRGLRTNPKAAGELFRTYAWDVEMGYTLRAKTEQFSWGLLQGKLEGK